MDYWYLFFLLAVFLFVYIRFSIPCARKYRRIQKLIDLESFETAYELIEELSLSKYGIFAGYSTTIIKKLINLESFEAAYNLIEKIFQNKYAVLVGYPERLLPYRAFCLLNLSCYREAILVYDRIIKSFKRAAFKNKATLKYLSQLHSYKSYALRQLEEFESSLACLDEAIKYQSDSPHIWYEKAYALSGLEKYWDSIVACDRALKYQPENCDIWFLKAYNFYMLEDNRNATINCDLVLQNEPNYHMAWTQKAMIAYRSGDYRKAITYCDRALEIEPDDNYALYGKACCYALLEEIDLAIDSIEQVIDLLPEFERELLDSNQDFSNLRQNPRFQVLLDRATK
ncbi:MAG: tetratricopeptide repeat protein [Cyanobacteria bacterium P01_A01_bin.40]